jgi:hypothetical protein
MVGTSNGGAQVLKEFSRGAILSLESGLITALRPPRRWAGDPPRFYTQPNDVLIQALPCGVSQTTVGLVFCCFIDNLRLAHLCEQFFDHGVGLGHPLEGKAIVHTPPHAVLGQKAAGNKRYSRIIDTDGLSEGVFEHPRGGH